METATTPRVRAPRPAPILPDPLKAADEAFIAAIKDFVGL